MMLQITLGSHCEKYSPYYIMSIDTVEAKTGKKHHLQAKETFTAWFDEQGYFVPKMFQKWVSINVPDIAAKKYVVEAMERAKEEKVKK